MSKITLSKALSLKKRLVGDIERLAKIIISNNSWRVDNEPEYDVNETYDKYVQAKKKLVDLKTAISAANAPIQGKIFQLAELKDQINTVRKIEAKKGKRLETVGRYGSESAEFEFTCAMGRKTLDEMTTILQDGIDELQADLDAFNANTQIEFEI